MKYYKLLTLDGWDNKRYSLNKVYQEDCIICLNSIKTKVKEYPKDWIEVPEYEYYLQEGLPEKWAIYRTIENCKDINEWNNNQLKNGKNYRCFASYCGDGDYFYSDASHTGTIREGYTEISFDTFKRLVLKQNDMKDREIIGYKLKDACEKYREAAEQIAGYHTCSMPLEHFLEKYQWGDFKKCLEKAGVLNLWFDAVYAEELNVGDWITYIGNKTTICTNGKAYKLLEIDRDGWIWHVCDTGERNGYNKKNYRKATPEEIKAAQYPQIEVNGYKGEFFDDYVKFGCAKIEKAYILKINDILSNTYWKRSDYKTITSITIGKGTFTEEQIKLIAEYYINK